jgi:hypothetical protein
MKVRWAVHVKRVSKIRNEHKILFEKREGKEMKLLKHRVSRKSEAILHLCYLA